MWRAKQHLYVGFAFFFFFNREGDEYAYTYKACTYTSGVEGVCTHRYMGAGLSCGFTLQDQER